MATNPWRALTTVIERGQRDAEKEPDARGYRALQRISAMVVLRDAVEDAVSAEVIRAREQGAQYDAIGRALGVTKQAAALHYGRATAAAERK